MSFSVDSQEHLSGHQTIPAAEVDDLFASGDGPPAKKLKQDRINRMCFFTGDNLATDTD